MTDLTKIDTPFGELDDATKGALLLAHHDCKAIEYYFTPLGEWKYSADPGFHPWTVYRVRPDPVIGTHTVNIFITEDARSKITIPTRDGKHVPGVYTSPEGLQILVEVAV